MFRAIRICFKVSTHYMDEAEILCDKIAILHRLVTKARKTTTEDKNIT